MLINLEIEAIIAVKTILRTDPEVALAILKNGQSRVLGKAIFNGEMLELDNTPRGDIEVNVKCCLCRTGSYPC
jgi:hypothetical protein